jgi:hypothetical protein
MVYRALHFVICQCTESLSILVSDLEAVARAVHNCKLGSCSLLIKETPLCMAPSRSSLRARPWLELPPRGLK